MIRSKHATFLVAAGIALNFFASRPADAAGTQALAAGGTRAAPAPTTATGTQAAPAVLGTQALAAGGTRAAIGTQALAGGGGTQAAPAGGTVAARPGQPLTLGTQALGAGGTRAAVGTQALAAGGTRAVGTQALAAGGTRAAIGTQALAAGGTRAAIGTQAARGTQAAGVHGQFAVVVPEIQGPLRTVSSKSPGTLIVLQDTSGSMFEEFIPGTQKAQAAANAINSTLADFVRASNQGGTIKDRWNVGVFHYGEDKVTNGLGGALGGAAINPISHVAQHPTDVLQIPDAEGQMVPSPLWVHAVAGGGTPMRQAFEHAANTVTGHEKNLVLGVHVTDGASTDGDPTAAVQQLAQKVAAGGGQLLLTNIHISKNADPTKAMVFPTPDEAANLDVHGKLLYALSSPVPSSLAEQLGTRPGARMFAYNAAPEQLAAVFRAGSSVAGGTVTR
jgi:Mg-chelatase subunit ChlD